METFWIASDQVFNCYPYIDLRGHLFNNGKGACNAGVGARFLRDRIWGFNTYYDFRATKKKNYNQLAAGFESMGVRWDFFANGYLVVGNKKSPSYDPHFSHFFDHHAYLKEKVDYAMSGFDGKVRYHFLKKEGWDVYFDIGPYCYFKKDNAIGAQAKLAAQIANYVFLEANTSYDRLFKWLGQGVIGINIPLGPKNSSAPTTNRSCHDAIVMRDRLTQIPSTQEIIVVHRHLHRLLAIDPLTGLPYHFMFVNNLFGSNGTYEDPYGSLAAAESASTTHDIIYVMFGDGTSTNMNSGITLKDYQQLLGSGTTQILSTQKGMIDIPSQTEGMPIISNAIPGGTGVTIANYNTISGIHIDRTDGEGIYGLGKSNVTITNNIISDINVGGAPSYFAIDLEGPGFTGTNTISANTFSQTGAADSGHGIYIQPGLNSPPSADICTINISDNQIQTLGYGIEMNNTDGTISLNIVRNTVSTIGKRAISIEPKVAGTTTIVLQDNTLSRPGNYAAVIQPRDLTEIQATIVGNHFINSATGFAILSGGTSNLVIADISNNVFTNNSSKDFFAENTASKPNRFCLTLQNNYAPDWGFQMKNEQSSEIFNVIFYSNNTPTSFTSTGSGAAITTNPTCP